MQTQLWQVMQHQLWFWRVEWESSETLLVPWVDHSADTLLTVIKTWIQLGSAMIGDC